MLAYGSLLDTSAEYEACSSWVLFKLVFYQRFFLQGSPVACCFLWEVHGGRPLSSIRIILDLDSDSLARLPQRYTEVVRRLKVLCHKSLHFGGFFFEKGLRWAYSVWGLGYPACSVTLTGSPCSKVAARRIVTIMQHAVRLFYNGRSSKNTGFRAIPMKHSIGTKYVSRIQ